MFQDWRPVREVRWSTFRLRPGDYGYGRSVKACFRRAKGDDRVQANGHDMASWVTTNQFSPIPG
jgi:hypothetical protein